MTASSHPFKDLVVIELGHSVAAPFAGQIFADLGATVIKVEKEQGDDARKWGPPFWEGASSMFQSLNRNKQSVVCDLRKPEHKEALLKLIDERADVLIQNLRPGQTEELGLDCATLLKRKPSLVYCNIGAFGKPGPLQDKPGYDPLMQAFGGIMSTTGEPGRPSVRVGASIVDMGTGMWGVIGILTTLMQRQTTGKGGVVDVSLFETATTWVSLLASQFLANGHISGKQGSGASGIVPYKAYAASDGELVIAAGSDSLFKSLAKAVGHPEWCDDERFISNPKRVEHQTELYRMLDDIIKMRTTKEWVTILESAGIPCSPVQSMADMVAHEQTQTLQLIQDVPNSEMKFFGLPMRINGVRSDIQTAPPALGQHNDLLFFKTETLKS
ncbi:MAG: CoA transferase [Betaproteobacteria bacterium]|nr:CoA transferase [Betaproteobacteria bacterium]